MKKYAFLGISAALMLVSISGCPYPTHTAVNERGDKRLSLTKPSDATVTRNGNAEVTIKIARDGFRDPVKVAFSDLPTGVEVKDRDNSIASEATSGTFTLHAKENAPAVTNHPVRVTITGPEGMTQTDIFKLTVKEK